MNKLEEYAAQAKAAWGDADAYREFEQKSAGRSPNEEKALGLGLMDIFAEFGAIRNGNPNAEEARKLVKKLQAYITNNYYTCTSEILTGLGQMYVAGGEMTENIDKYAGKGTADFVNKAIESLCLSNGEMP